MKNNLVAIKPPEYDVVLDIAYASQNNFTGRVLYENADCLLHPDAALLLKKSVKYAANIGFKIKIFDGFRPISVQRNLWQDYPNPEFLSNPDTGAVPHCRGVAVDLTLLDEHGNELDMGTKFDEFSHYSHHGNMEISKTAQYNRHLLMGVMTTSGWDFYRNEWWHYQMFKPRDYPVMDV